MLSHASLSIAGAKVLLYNISSKCFCHFFSIIFFLSWLSRRYEYTFSLRSFESDTFFSLDFVSPFFWLDPKEPKGQGYTSKATNSLRSAKIPDNSRFALRQPGFLYAPLAICFTPSPLGRSFLSLAFRSSLLFFFLSSYFSPFNSQFSTLHSQLTKSRRVFIISRRLFNKRRRLFSISSLPF